VSGSVRQPCGARDGLPTVQGDATTFISARVRTGFLDATRRASAATARGRPESLCLGVRPGFRASDAPPVHIYVGSEPAQLRALRVLLWSIERTRDPRRVYHVHVMSDLDGFDRRGWTTGFTNYRFAIPEFANGCGRAIYCEASQVFLADPGGLFDLDLHDALGRAHGYLAISDADPSVMLIDCASMARWWTRDTARRRSKKTALKRTLRQPFVRGALDARWNARDEEYVAGVSKLLNYATLHRQPWRPFPERFAYRPHRESALWHELERDAIAAGFTGFGASAPTRAFLALHGQRGAGLKAVSVPGSPVDHQLREIVGAAGVESVS